MYTIKQAARLTGVPEASLRAWERRYGVVVPQRNGSGYRVYDEQALAAISTMRRLVDDGWSPAEAAEAVRNGTAPAAPDGDVSTGDPAGVPALSGDHYAQQFIDSATRMDAAGIEASLDGGFALGSFEHVVDTWLFPALEALGEGWAQGDVDVAGEHAASNAVHRRLSAAFDAAGSRSRGPAVGVGLPSAVTVADKLLDRWPTLLMCAGGSSAADLRDGVHTLPSSIAAAAEALDRLVGPVDR
jgi:DNA-binding transcriptional MerR regulator